MATIEDVAKKAGVGRGTVSRVINNSPLVSKETREKVLKAIEELNYYPSSVARGLANDQTYTIGIIMDNSMDKVYANPFIYEVFRGIERSVYEGGYNLLLLGKDTYIRQKLAVEVILQSKSVDGLILPSQLIMSDFMDHLKDHSIPIVSMGKIEGNRRYSWVDIDNFQAGYLAAEFLYSKGYRNIGFVGFEPDKIFAKERYAGYQKFIKEKHLPSPSLSPDSDLTNVDALICLDNIYAFKMLQKCKHQSFKVPDDIGIITFDDYPLAEYLEPTITNIEIDLYEMGRQIGYEMLRKVKEKGGEPREITIPVSVNVRESTRR